MDKSTKTVFIKPIHPENKTIPYTANVLTMGNKWFTVDGAARHCKFDIKTFIQKESDIGWSREYEVFESEDAYNELVQIENNRTYIKNRVHNLTKNQIKHIMEVINTNLYL